MRKPLTRRSFPDFKAGKLENIIAARLSASAKHSARFSHAQQIVKNFKALANANSRGFSGFEWLGQSSHAGECRPQRTHG